MAHLPLPHLSAEQAVSIVFTVLVVGGRLGAYVIDRLDARKAHAHTEDWAVVLPLVRR